jgi:TRAP-type C4-dicarboxylate transport system substrate-binding protein
MAAKVPVTSWDALKGQKIRAWSKELVDFVNLLGGTGVSMDFGEVAAALATGLVDGVISNSGIMYDSGFYEQCKYINVMEIQFGIPFIVVSQDAIGALPADVQKAVRETLREHQPYIIEGGIRDADVKALKATVDFEATLVSFPKAMRKEVEEKCRTEIWPIWAQRAGAEGAKAIELVEAAKKKVLQ